MKNNKMLRQYREMVRSHYGLSDSEMRFAPWWLKKWRRLTVITRDFFGMPRKIY